MGPNHPFVVWVACFLWIISVFSITWSLMLFLILGDILILTGTDLVNALVLLMGILMLPGTVHMLYAIAKGQRIDMNAKVLCCPLWLSNVWIIIIACAGIAACLQRIYACEQTTFNSLRDSMHNYRAVPRYKHYLDNVQWSLKCCGLNSYKDWFREDWYDKVRDYEWDPSSKRKRDAKTQDFVADSVPLSCCKSGSCVSNYLMELGTHSINKRGCHPSIYRIMLFVLNAHLIFFIAIAIAELLLLKYIACKSEGSESPSASYEKLGGVQVSNLMAINNKFDLTSGSSTCNFDVSEDDSKVVAINCDIQNDCRCNENIIYDNE